MADRAVWKEWRDSEVTQEVLSYLTAREAELTQGIIQVASTGTCSEAIVQTSVKLTGAILAIRELKNTIAHNCGEDVDE